MENPQLNSLLSQLENTVSDYISKKANITEKDVLEGDRTDTLPAGEPQKVVEEELTDDSFTSGNPVQEGYDPNFGEEYNLSEKRLEEEVAAEKSAKLANEIVSFYAKKASEPAKKTPQAKKQAMSKEAEEQYKVVEASMMKALKDNGGPMLHTIAATVDPEYVKIASERMGSTLADATLSYLRGADLSSSHIQGYEKAAFLINGSNDLNSSHMQGYEKAASLISGNIVADNVISHLMGMQKASQIIQKVAADLVAVNPVIQELESKNLITQAEKEALTSSLAASDQLTPEVINQATSGMSNADIIAGALLKAITGKVADNVPLEPVTQATVTESAPGTLDPNNPEDKIIEAAAMIIKKRKGCKK